MNRYEVVFKIRLSKKLRDSIIEDAQKREKKTSVHVREQLDRTFRFSQTDIKKIEEKVNAISNEGKRINSIARKHNTDGMEKYNLEDAIYSACDISEKRIKSLEEEIKNPRNFMTLCEVRQMLKAARKEEKIIDGMFKKTSLGRMVGLKPEEKTKKEKQKENNMHGH